MVYFPTDCGDPQPAPHADVDGGSTTIGSVRNYGCLTGYLPTGSGSVTCLDNATWSSMEIQCTGLEQIGKHYLD
jgi:hypothetical protein